MKKSIKLIGLLLLAVCFLTSCSTYKKVGYFQDTDSLKWIKTQTFTPLRVQKGDRIYIQVKVQGSEILNSMFSMMGGTSYSNITSTQNSPYGYTVNDKGNIDFPVVGSIHVEGLTRSQVEATVKKAILDNGQARDVAVAVTFMNLAVSVIGEVQSPGRYTIEKDDVTILDAISMAKDLTIYGKRENVKVLRQEGDHQNVYTIDLTNAEQVMNSPVYYLKQNDVVYVEPNKAKSQNSEIGSMTTLWFSATSIGVSLISLLVNILK